MTGPRTMKAIRLHAPGVDGLRQETIETPTLRAGEVLVEVHAAAITRHELEWPLDRLPHDSPYELSGVVAAADDVAEVSVGDEVYALTLFDRDGVAAEYAAVAATLLAPKRGIAQPRESAAVPLPLTRRPRPVSGLDWPNRGRRDWPCSRKMAARCTGGR